MKAAARLRLGAFVALALVGLVVGAASSPAAGSPNLVVSQVYGGGGNSGSTQTHDYIEIFNRGTTAVPLGDYSLQYASATGTGNLGANAGQLTELPAVSLPPGRYFLVQEASSISPAPAPSFTADYTGDTSPINMAAGAGKVALVSGTAGLGCNGGSAACGSDALARIVDLVGYGNANFFETAAAPALSATAAGFRAGEGCTDTDNNAADFTTGAPAPRSLATAARSCDAPTPLGISVAAVPAEAAPGANMTMRATITPGSDPASTGLLVTCDLSWAGRGSTASLFDDGTNGDSTAGDLVFTLQFMIPLATAQGSKVGDCRVSDDQSRTKAASYTVDVSEAVAPTTIHDIQGAAHLSPKAGQNVSDVRGIVTAKRSSGFYMQDPAPDADAATSEGIFVFASASPPIGDLVSVNGRVQEFRPGGAATNLTVTELVPSSAPSTISSGNDLPAATVVGAGGRVPPTSVIEDDAAGGDVESPGAVFDPAQDGIDFYESLEGMRLQIDNAVVVGPRNSFGEVWVLPDNGATAGPRTNRGGIVVTPTDFNPERIQLDDAAGTATPNVNVGDDFTTSVTGVLDYDFGNFELEVTAPLARVADGVTRESATAAAANELSVATFNVENLDRSSRRRSSTPWHARWSTT